MKKIMLVCLMLIIEASSAVAGEKNKTSQSEMEIIYESSGIEKKNDKFHLLDNTDIEVEPDIKHVDLNGDGIDEVFVMLNNYSGAYGNAEGNLILLIKDKNKKFNKNIDYPVSAYSILKNKFKGYPDIDLTIPGYCSSVWRWDGKKYNFFKKKCVQGYKE